MEEKVGFILSFVPCSPDFAVKGLTSADEEEAQVPWHPSTFRALAHKHLTRYRFLCMYLKENQLEVHDT